jgi:glycosyltransferase involved in cell wall biosynthesis/cytochrome c-type biogenesis protein CcmH/NrfG
MHRSGTSAITRGLSALGVSLGDNLYPPHPDNPTGYWEDNDCIQINEELLERSNANVHSLERRLHLTSNDPVICDLRVRAAEVLGRRLGASGGLWAFKDPRTCRLLDFWLPVATATGAAVSFVLAVRNPMSVARSLESRQQTPAEKSYLLWLQHVVPSVRGTDGADRRVVVDYDRMMDNPRRELSRMAESLGLALDPSSATVGEYTKSFLEEDLRHARFSIADLLLDSRAHSAVAPSYELLLEAACDRMSMDSEEIRRMFTTAAAQLEDLGPAIAYAKALEAERVQVAKTAEDYRVDLFNTGEFVRQMEQLAASERGRAEAAERQVAMERSRADAAEVQIKGQQERAEAAEQSVADLRGRSEFAERQALAERARTETAEAQAAVQRDRALLAEKHVLELLDRNAFAEQQVVVERTRGEAAEGRAADFRDRAAAAERQAVAAEGRAAAETARADAADRGVAALRAEIEATSKLAEVQNNRRAAAERQAEFQTRRAEGAEQLVDGERARAQEAAKSATQLGEQAAELALRAEQAEERLIAEHNLLISVEQQLATERDRAEAAAAQAAADVERARTAADLAADLAAQAEDRLVAYRDRLLSAERQLAAELERASAAEQLLAEQRQHSADAERRAAAARLSADNAEHEAAAQRRRAVEAEENSRQQGAQRRALEEQFGAAMERVAALEARRRWSVPGLPLYIARLVGWLVVWVATLGPNAVKAHREAKLGDKARRQYDWVGAATHYRAHLRLRPQKFAIWVQLGHALKESRRFDEALGAYGEALRLEPRNADLLLSLGHLHALMGHRQTAVSFYRRSVAEDPRSPAQKELDRTPSLGFALPGEAIATPEDPSDPIPSWFARLSDVDGRRAQRRGDEARGRRDWVGAAKQYRLHLQARPDHFPIWVQLGHALKESGRFDRALGAYGQALSLEPLDADLLVNMGHIHQRMGHGETASRFYRRGAELGAKSGESPGLPPPTLLSNERADPSVPVEQQPWRPSADLPPAPMEGPREEVKGATAESVEPSRRPSATSEVAQAPREVWFDPSWYAATNGDAEVFNYHHFVTRGAAEGRLSSALVERIMRLFAPGERFSLDVYGALLQTNWPEDLSWHVAWMLTCLFVPQWHDDSLSPLEGFIGYLRGGLLTGDVAPGPLFDAALYRDRAAEAGLPPLGEETALMHWLRYGLPARIVPTDRYDEAFYRRSNPDIDAAPMWGFTHFIEHGVFEGRAASDRPTFSSAEQAAKPGDTRLPKLYRHWHALDFPESEGMAGSIPARYERRLEAFARSDHLERTFALARAIDPSVGELSTIAEFLLPPFHIGDGMPSAHVEVQRRLPALRYDSVICVPWIRTGGADLVAGMLASALLRIRPDERVLILRTDNPHFERADWLPQAADCVDISDLTSPMSPPIAEKFLRVILRGLTARRVFNVNSRLCWTAMRGAGVNMAATARNYAYLFCWDQTASGARAGYPAEFFAETAGNMTAFLTDTEYLRRELTTMYQLPGPARDRIVPLFTPAQSPLLTPSIARRVMDQADAGSRRLVLWAGRLDRQKRFGLVLDIARRMPDVEFRCWGEALLDAPPDLSKMPANVRLQGSFGSFDDLPLADAGAWLFTSLWEGMPTTLIELATRGVPVVASAVGGVPELIQPETGWPVPEDASLDDYVAALEDALASPKEAVQRAEALQRKVCAIYSEATYDRALDALLMAEESS